ncbi:MULTISPECIES: dihydroneopterin aldolase [unclassified Paenibacillus]|uniref:dihydroneopterin aldolase n=1 Tax=unclassified Paenibacillus TaxID=185978 RepID=UPI00070AB2F9|nr:MULTISPECIES: dihydroneopterin aldolase [unclassified Paenibacillus]KQX57768.1 dihydroneopterin aldolase [Paenibacillus sp. Root444D2]KRE45462.1 dihydroneopterin aldolase [Paenibacillus sp. Soil724D2]
MDKITLSRMQFFGNHGVFPEENKLGQRFYVDVEFMLPLDKPGKSDHLDDTVNYGEVFFKVKEVVEGRTYKLIEALAENIASELLHTYTSINEVTVRVIKPHPPFAVFFDGVTVEINRKRANE